MGSSLVVGSSFPSSGFVSSGDFSGTSCGTEVASEAKVRGSKGKTLAGVTAVSWCSRD